MNEIELIGGQHVMDSRQIAELTGKAHRNVTIDIETQLGQLEGGVQRFQHTYQNEQNGQTYRCYKLPRRECLILVSGYNVELRAAIIDRWEALETGKAIPYRHQQSSAMVPTGSNLDVIQAGYKALILLRSKPEQKMERTNFKNGRDFNLHFVVEVRLEGNRQVKRNFKRACDFTSLSVERKREIGATRKEEIRLLGGEEFQRAGALNVPGQGAFE